MGGKLRNEICVPFSYFLILNHIDIIAIQQIKRTSIQGEKSFRMVQLMDHFMDSVQYIN
jgi:hypothetical protein